jgi:hypothetical protein
VRSVFFLLTLIVTQAVARVQTFDPAFFDDGDAVGNYGEPHVDEFSDNFFSSDRGKLSKTRAGNYGCTSVRAATSGQTTGGQVAGEVGRKAQKYCAGRPDIKFIPPLDPSRKSGYFLVCCFKKANY